PLGQGWHMLKTNPLELVEYANQILEQAPSIAVFTQKTGRVTGPSLPGHILTSPAHGDVERAALTARNARVDFGNANPYVAAVNPVSAFLNANLKGGYNAVEPLTQRAGPERARAALRLGILTAAAAAAYAWNTRDVDAEHQYNLIPGYRRFNNIILM